jgi:translation initiation factor eIF-2B subunit alpha
LISDAALSDADRAVLRDLQSFLSSSSDNNISKDMSFGDGSATELSPSSSLFDKSSTAVPVAAIKVLLGVVQRSHAGTIMGLQDELHQAMDCIVKYAFKRRASSASSSLSISYHKQSPIALHSGCQLFLRYITRTYLELPEFDECRRAILARGEYFHHISLAARDRVATNGAEYVILYSEDTVTCNVFQFMNCCFIFPCCYSFIRDGMTVLTHGWSRTVAAVLDYAFSVQNKHFDVIILEGQPDQAGRKAAASYNAHHIPTSVILDCAMYFAMESAVDLVLVGAEGVVENGGVVNKIGYVMRYNE